MHLRTFSVAGIGAAALLLALMTSGASASGSGSSGIAFRASGASPSRISAVSDRSTTTGKTGKCGTGFGEELPSVDGIISWNDTTGAMDSAGAADVVCGERTKIKRISVLGYDGAVSETFHVTFFGDSATGGSSEPKDSKVLCDYPALTGAAGGQFPDHALTRLRLTSPCKLKTGVSWVSIQSVDATTPWYWEMQDGPQSGAAGPDWGDRPDTFGSGCTTYDNNRYLVECLSYPYADWMLLLE